VGAAVVWSVIWVFSIEDVGLFPGRGESSYGGIQRN